MKTLKQQLQEHDRKLYNTPICGSPLYQERDVLEAVKKWLEQKRQEEQETYDYLTPKAKDDIIHRSMWLSEGAVLDFIDKKLLEELKQ